MVCYENFVKVKNKAIFYSWKSNKSSVTINNTCGVGVLFVRACTCKLVYIRRKLMCNFVQLLGNVCWCHTATWRVSNETDIKAAKKNARSFVCCLHNLQHKCLHCQHEKWLLGSLIILGGGGVTGYIVTSKLSPFDLNEAPWGVVCDKCKLQAGR